MDVISILKKVGALIPNDHFVGTSGMHIDTYINKDALYPHTKETSEVGKLFAEKYKDKNIDVVVAPALGGIILSVWTAHHLSELNSKDILGIYTEKTPEGSQIFTRGYDKFVNGNKCAIEVETGTKIKKDRKMIEDKIEKLKSNYDGWFFVITDNHYLKDYKKIAPVLEVRSLRGKLNKLLKMTRAK